MTIIENSTIDGLAANDALVKEFPFLKESAPKPSGCACRQQSQPGLNYNQIKIRIATLPASSKAKFKQLTGWSNVRITYAAGQRTATEEF